MERPANETRTAVGAAARSARASDPVRAAYRYEPAVVDVATDDADAARWLAEFLAPWFDVGAADGADAAVRLITSAAAFTELDRRRAAAATDPIPCFSLDSQLVSLPGWEDEDGTTVIADSELCFYRLRDHHVEIVTRPGTLRVRVSLMRVVREIAAARMLAQPSVVDLHAAAFAMPEGAVLLVGPKRAGKTTLLAHVLTSGRASLIANDRVFVDTRHPQVAVGMPTLVSIQEHTLKLFPALRRHPQERPALLHADEPESRAARPRENGGPRVFALSPAQLARRLGAPTRRSAPIAAIVFPEVSPDVATWSLERIAPAEGSSRLRPCVYGARLPGRSQTIFAQAVGKQDRRVSEPKALLDRLTAQLPIFRCRLGPGAYGDGADAWLRALPLVPAAPEPGP